MDTKATEQLSQLDAALVLLDLGRLVIHEREEKPDESVPEVRSSGRRFLTSTILKKERQILRSNRDAAKVVRKLLHLHFTPETLMSHSLTGKASPAFYKYNPKPQLNQSIVAHIIRITVKYFKIERHIVRQAMTTALADAVKLKANRHLVTGKYRKCLRRTRKN